MHLIRKRESLEDLLATTVEVELRVENSVLNNHQPT